MRLLVAISGAVLVVSACVVPVLAAGDDAGNPTVAAHHHHEGGDPSLTLTAQLATARQVAAQWPIAADALADGWILATGYSTHVGAHYMRFAEIDGQFDVSRPEMLLYGGDAPDSPIVGLAYYVLYTLPDGFLGPTDVWHQHLDVCIGPDGPLVGADGVGVCATAMHMKMPGERAWMLHAWVVP